MQPTATVSVATVSAAATVSVATDDTAVPLLDTDKPPETEVIAVRQTPRVSSKQEELQSALATVHDDVNYMHKRKCQGLLTKEECDTLKKKQNKLDGLKRDLEKCKKNQARQQRFRDNLKRKLDNLDDDTRKKLKGTPDDHPTTTDGEDILLKTIVDIAIGGSAADERRRSEVIRTVRTLDDLTAALKKQGFHLSRSAVYLRHLPRNSATQEGKRHVKTVPVKLTRAQNDKHSTHADTLFARASISNLDELASLLGPQEVTFHSQDDKARVPIGLTAANKQAPLLMHMEYKVRLTDHDFVIAPRHKLVPSMIASMTVKKNSKMAVTYSGPTYVGIRSAKHSTSSACHHLFDMKRIRGLDEFRESLFCDDGSSKPVMIITVDGGPDENPRYSKTVMCSIDYFVSCNLDALFVATNAPGRSAYNRVERRMAPLSHDLAGIVLPHDHFGSHLNSAGLTVDEDMEAKNFEKAGQVLSESWSETVIDGHPTVAEYISPSEDEMPMLKDQAWHKAHVRESQYMLQIVKCRDRSCCEEPRSSYFTVVKDRFLPPPLPLLQTEDGLTCRANDVNAGFPSLFLQMLLGNDVIPPGMKRRYAKGVPYDFSCPTLQTERKRICEKCGLYHASIKSMKAHHRQCDDGTTTGPVHQAPVARIRPQRVAARQQRELMCLITRMDNEEFEWLDEDDVDTEGIEISEIAQLTVQPGTPLLPPNSREPAWQEDA